MTLFNPIYALNKSLGDCIDGVVSNFSDFIEHPGKDFSHSSPLDFRTTLMIPYLLNKGSIPDNMVRFADKLDLDVQSSSVTEARQKIKPSAGEQIFNSFNRRTRRHLLFKGKELYLVDGSQVPVYGKCGLADLNPDGSDPCLAKTKKGKHRRFVHVNALFNALEKTFESFIIQKGSEMNEDEALMEFAHNLQVGLNMAILICDRGYQNQMSFYQLQKLGQYFLIRIMDKESKGSITKDFDLPDEDVYDVQRDVLLSSDQRTALLKKQGETRPVKYISNHDQYKEFTDEVTKLPLSLRITRIKCVTFHDPEKPNNKNRQGILIFTSDHPDTAAEAFQLDNRLIRTLDDLKQAGLAVLATSWMSFASNLPFEEFSASDIAHLYKIRWQIETGFFHLKEDAGLRKLHSRCLPLIKQEIYAAATVYNLGSRVRNRLEEERKRRSERRRKRKQNSQRALNLGYIIELLRYHMFSLDTGLCKKCAEMILRRTHEVHKDLPDTRK